MAEHFLAQLGRLLLGIALGLFIANMLEALRWTDGLARLARPFAAFAHFGPVAASAFALAFVSPAAANGFLSEKLVQGQIDSKELMLANLFNGLPAWISHTPTIFLLIWPVLGPAALYYIGVTCIAALARTIFVMLIARSILTQTSFTASPTAPVANQGIRRLHTVLKKAWLRFKKRIVKLILFTAPVYAIMWASQKYGFFGTAEDWLARHLDWLTFLKPQAMGIIVLQLIAEMGATLGAAGACLQDGSLTARDIVAAMLVGNVLATPLRAIRHQLPVYAGFFQPVLAIKLVLANQGLRAASMILAIAAYLFLAP